MLTLSLVLFHCPAGFRRPMMMFTKLQSSSRPVSRRPSTERPPATVTLSIPVATLQPLMQPAASSSTTVTPGVGDKTRSKVKEKLLVETIPTAAAQPLMKPEVSSSAAETSGIGKKVRSTPVETIPTATAQPLMKSEVSSSGIVKKVRSNVKKEPSVETIPTATAPQSSMKSEVSSSSSGAETSDFGKKGMSKVKEEPSVETIPTAAPQSSMKQEVSSSAAESLGFGKEVRSGVVRKPKVEPMAEKEEEMEGVKVEVMDATDIQEGAEKKGVAVTIKHEDKKVTDDTASDAVAMATVKIKAEKMEEKGDIKPSS